MKTMRPKLFIALGTLLFILFVSASFKTGKAKAQLIEYATIRTTEVPLAGPKIILIYEGKTEEFDLDKASASNWAPNALKINQAINLLASKGYELVAQSGGEYVSMYTFIKK